MTLIHKVLASTLLLAAAATAQADIQVGVSVSATGPAASLGMAEKNTIALLPAVIAGHKVHYTVLDDATDTTAAVSNARKFIAEHKVDVIVGSTTTPNTLAMLDVAAEAGTPLISMAANASIVEPVQGKRRWAFKTPQNDMTMASAIAKHMAAGGVKTVGFIGFADAYGEGWQQEFAKAAALHNIKLVASERYNRNDTSVTGQVLKLIAAKPDAVLVGASGTPAVLPQRALKERGYRGTFYQTHGAANNEFLRLGGKDVEGTFLPAGPVLVARQLPVQHPVRASALAYIEPYEARYGAGSASVFGAHAWDAGVLLQASVGAALKVAKPGTAEFRSALRDSLESLKEVAGAHGVFNTSPQEHQGFDARAVVMVKVENGAWKYLP